MVSFVYDGATRRLPVAKEYILQEMEKYLLGKKTGREGFVELMKDSIDELEATDADPNELIAQLKIIFEELLDRPLKPYLDYNREALSSFLKRRPEKRKIKDKKMIDEASLKNIVEDKEEFDKGLVSQLSGTVVSDVAGIAESIRKDIIGQISGMEISDTEIAYGMDSLPTLEIQTEIRFKTAKTIQGENKLSFSKSNNRGNKNAHSILTFPSDDGMEVIVTKAQDLIIEYTGAEVAILPKKGKVLIDSAIDKKGIENAIKFSSMDKYIEDGEIKDGLQFDYEFIDELNAKLETWFQENIGNTDEYFGAMVQDGIMYQLMVEVSLVREQKSTKSLTQRVADTIEITDTEGNVTRKVKDKYSKFTATKYKIPKAIAINPNFDITEGKEYPLIPMKEYKIPDELKPKKGKDTQAKRNARQKIYNKLKEERQKILAQYNELKAATTEIEVDGNKYLLIYANSPIYKKAEKAYDEFGFGNNKIKKIVHSFFDEKFEMLKREGTGKFKDKVLFASDFQGQERLMYAYIDRTEESITEEEAKQIEEGDFRVVQEKYGEAFFDYMFYRKDKVKKTDRGKYADLGLNEGQRADLYYYILTGNRDVKLPSILGSTQSYSKKLLDALGISYSDKDIVKPTGVSQSASQRELEGRYDSRTRLSADELNKQEIDLDDISVEKKMTPKRWIKLYEVNKQAAQIYILLPLVSETAIVEDVEVIEGRKFGAEKYEASAFTVEDLMQVESDKKDKDDKPIMVDNEEDVKVLYSVYLKKYAEYNLSPIRNRGQNRAMKKYLDQLANKIVDIREIMEGY